MKDKNKKISPKKYELVVAPPYTEGHWEGEFEYTEKKSSKKEKQTILNKLKEKYCRR
jgi:hypothetical protein